MSDPTLWLAIALGVLGVIAYARFGPKPPLVPTCKDCGEELIREEEIRDQEHPELQHIAGQRRAWFRCPQCNRRSRWRY
jgi:predicted RNA-binding Zn-ribbon protein involved in translation (DUF1610 family)